MFQHTDTGVAQERIHPPGRVPGYILPWLILAVALCLTVAFWFDWRQQHIHELQDEVRDQADRISAMVQTSLQSIELMLLGVTGLFESSDGVSLQEFRDYVTALQLPERAPEIQGIGYAPLIRAPELGEQLRMLRSEVFAHFAITPDGWRESYAPIAFFEPLDIRNQDAIGFDMFSEHTRMIALRHAWETGEISISGKVRLQGPQSSPGSVIYAPIYRPESPHETPEQRRRDLLGWAFAPLRIERFMNTLLETNFPGFARHTKIELFEGQVTDFHTVRPFFDSYPVQAPTDRQFRHTRTFPVAGHVWTIRIYPLPSFYRKHAPKKMHDSLLLYSGITLSCLFSILIRALIRSRARASAALTDTLEANRALQHSRQQLQLIFDTTETAIFLTDREGRITCANERMATLFHCRLDELIDKAYVDLVSSGEREEAINHLHMQLDESTTTSACVERLHQQLDGGQFWGYVGLRPVTDEHHDLLGLVGAISDISQRKKSEERIRYLAHHDYLTGLPNRSLFVERLDQALKLARRYNRRLGLLFLDLDGFKLVNDIHGHQTGDRILREVAARMKRHVRASDTVARLGGDEFVILVPELADMDHLALFAEHVNTILAAPYELTDPPSILGASIGMATYPEHGEDLDTLLQNADTAMYTVKNTGDHVPRYPSPSD